MNHLVKLAASALIALTLLSPSSLLWADEFAVAALQLCDKVRACALKEMEHQELTPDLRNMLEPMLQGMCRALQANIQNVPKDHVLYQPSIDCLRSMGELSCDAMRNRNDVMTPQCQAYEKAVEGEGVALP